MTKKQMQKNILVITFLILLALWLSQKGYFGRKELPEGYIYYDDFEIPFDMTDNSQLIYLHSETSDFSITCKSQGNCGSDHPGYYIDRCTYRGKDEFGCDIWDNYYQSINEVDYSDKGTTVYGGADTSSGNAIRQFNVDLTKDIERGAQITKAYLRVNYDGSFTCDLNGKSITGANRRIIDMTSALINGQNVLTCNKPFEAWIFHNSNCIKMCNLLHTNPRAPGSCQEESPLPKNFINNEVVSGCDCDGYTECATDKWLFIDNNWGKFNYDNGMIKQGSGRCTGGTQSIRCQMGGGIKTVKNFDVRNKNIKILGETVASAGRSIGFTLNFPGTGIWSLPSEYASPGCHYDYSRHAHICPPPQMYFVEIKHEPSDDTITYIYVNGRLEKTFTHEDVDTLSPYMEITGSFDYIAWKPVFGCQQGPQDLLGMETFNAGTTISLYSTRHPIKRLCYEHLPILTKSEESGSTVSSKIYDDLIKGKLYQVKEDETLTLFYIFYNDGRIKMTCENEAYDFNNNRCTNLTGVVYFCSAGTFDPAVGSCVVTPEQKIWCPEGRYDVAQGVCIYSPPVQAVCPSIEVPK